MPEMAESVIYFRCRFEGMYLFLLSLITNMNTDDRMKRIRHSSRGEKASSAILEAI
jgi:hypothetical protein